MKTIKTSSLSEYIKALEELGMENYIYRGQNEPYFGIKANGFRPYMGSFFSDKIYNIDEISRDYYKRVSSRLTSNERENFLAFCQHYGIPTNLIDFTYSPLVALFFACYGKEEPKFTVSELVDNVDIEKLKYDKEIQKILIHNLINKLEKPMLSQYAQVYLIKKKWIIDITDIILESGNNNIFELIFKDKNVRNILVTKLINLFRDNNIELDEISESIIELIESYKENSINIFGDYCYEYATSEDEDDYEKLIKSEKLFEYQEMLKKSKNKNTIREIYKYVYNLVEDENIPYEMQLIDYNINDELYRLCASTYVILLANLLQILCMEFGKFQNIILNLKIYFKYEPDNLFDRISYQKGTFIYQPYFYESEGVYDFHILFTQNVNPDICIEVENYEKILYELDLVGINLESIYGDLDNISKSVVYSYKMKNNI